VFVDAKRGGYQVSIAINRKTIFLGRCKTLEEGASIYREGAIKYHGEFGCFE
jgi:hypothetical protein